MAGGVTAAVVASFVLGVALIVTLVVLVLAALRGRGAIVLRAGIVLVVVLTAGAIVAWLLGTMVDPRDVVAG